MLSCTILVQNRPKRNRGLRWIAQPPDLSGAEGQSRTADTGIFSPLLYRLSYLGTVSLWGCLSSPSRYRCIFINSAGVKSGIAYGIAQGICQAISGASKGGVSLAERCCYSASHDFGGDVQSPKRYCTRDTAAIVAVSDRRIRGPREAN